MSSSKGASQQIKLPLQLASLIHGDAAGNDLEEEDGGKNLNTIVAAAQTRHVKELGSYVRAVCMRMGYAP